MIFIMFSAFGLRLLSSLFQNPLHWPDSNAYHNLAVSILTSGIYANTHWAPIYPYFLAFLYSLFGVNIQIIIVIQSIIGSMTCFLLFLIGKNLFNVRIGILSAVLLAFYPFHVFLSGVILTEVIFIFLLLIWIYLAVKVGDNIYLIAVISGILSGLLILTRPAALILLPVMFFYLMIRQSLDWKKRTIFISIMIALCLFSLLPWTLKNYTEKGIIIISSTAGGVNFWRGNNPLAGASHKKYLTAKFKEKARLLRIYGGDKALSSNQIKESLYYRAALNWIKENPGQFVFLYIKKFLNFWRLTPDQVTRVKHFSLIKIASVAAILPLYIFSIGGIFLSRQYWRKLSIIYLTALSFPLGLSLFLTSFRHRIVIDPFLIIPSAFCFCWLIDRKSGRSIKMA